MTSYILCQAPKLPTLLTQIPEKGVALASLPARWVIPVGVVVVMVAMIPNDTYISVPCDFTHF